MSRFCHSRSLLPCTRHSVFYLLFLLTTMGTKISIIRESNGRKRDGSSDAGTYQKSRVLSLKSAFKGAFTRVVDLKTFSSFAGKRLHFILDDRYVSLIRHRGKLYCIDSVCYHVGGPLTLGDIEDIGGRSCIKCPWHHFRVDLATGEAIERDGMSKSDPFYPKGKNNENGNTSSWVSVGLKQRVHEVKETEDGIYVRLNESDPNYVDSDDYSRGPQFAPQNAGSHK